MRNEVFNLLLIENKVYFCGEDKNERLMNKKYLVGSLFLSLPMAMWGQSKDRPNVLIIYADDLGYGDLGCYGAKGVETPNIDKLAEEGVRFTNAYAMAATSTPSRYGMLTGEYAWRKPGTDVAAGDAGMIIKPEQFTLSDLFKQAGYATAAIGKWHLGLGPETGKQDWNKPLTMGLKDLGFDYHYIMAATADRTPCVFIEQDTVANYDPSAPIEVSYLRPFAGEPLGRTHPELLQLRSSHGHDMAIVNGIGRIGYSRGGGRALWKDENIADSITAKAVQFIREHKDQPFFMYYATNDVHVPRFPHPRFRGKSSMGLRGDAIVQFDWAVGELLRTLDELGIRDNTIILISSDNGAVVDDGYEDRAEELLGEHRPSGGLRGFKYSAFEGGTRVPAILSWRRGQQGKGTSDRVVSQADWLASFAHLLDITLSSGAASDSRPALSAWLGRHDAPHRSHVIGQAANKTLSVRTPEWKYIELSNGAPMITWGPKIETGYLPRPQLYHLPSDPEERHNVADKHPDIVRRMQAILQKERNP